MTERLLALATRHGNVLSTAMATGIDLDRHALEDLCRDGTLRRLRRAAYVLGSAWDAATPEGRLALRTRAVMADRPDWVVTHASALALHGLPLFGVSLDIVDVQGPVQRTRVRSGVRVHPRHPEALVVDRGGVACMALPMALAQVLRVPSPPPTSRPWVK